MSVLRIFSLYEAIGRPLVTYQSFWGIYRQLHHAFEAIIDLDPVISAVPDTVSHIDNEKLSLLPDMQELRGGDGVHLTLAILEKMMVCMPILRTQIK